MSRGKTCLLLVLAFAASATYGCGSGPSSPSGAPVADVTVTIDPSGVSPKEVHIKALGRVLFVNNDVRPHQIASDPITIHTDCPGINQVGLLAPGTRAQTGALPAVRSCGYHDHLDELNATWQGRIVIE